MEPVSVIASIGGILQSAATVVQYLKDIKGGPEERKRIQDNLASTIELLYQLKNMAETERGQDSWLMTIMKPLMVPKGALEQFQMALDALAAKLAPAHGFKKFGKALVWPFEKGEVKGILETIEGQKNTFSLMLQMGQLLVVGYPPSTHRMLNSVFAVICRLPARLTWRA